MRKNLFLSKTVMIVGIFCLFSCDKSEDPFSNSCDVSDPIEELTWLNDAIEEIQDDPFSYYSMGKLDGETVFFYDSCNPLINYASILIDCNGDRIGLKNDFLDELSDVIILWKHEETSCNL